MSQMPSVQVTTSPGCSSVQSGVAKPDAGHESPRLASTHAHDGDAAHDAGSAMHVGAVGNTPLAVS